MGRKGRDTVGRVCDRAAAWSVEQQLCDRMAWPNDCVGAGGGDGWSGPSCGVVCAVDGRNAGATPPPRAARARARILYRIKIVYKIQGGTGENSNDRIRYKTLLLLLFICAARK